MSDVALHPLAASADVDLFVLQSYELEFAADVHLAAAATGVLTPAAVPPPVTGGAGGDYHRGYARPSPVPPRPPARHAVHCSAALTLTASMTLAVAPYGRWAAQEDELILLDLI